MSRGIWRGRMATLFVGVLALALLGAACADDSSDTDDTGADVLGDQLTVTVTDDGVSPDGIELIAPAEYQLTVVNSSAEACNFSFGGLVRDLAVAAGESETISFSSVDSDDNDSVEIGCGDDRSAEARIRAPGS